MDFLQKLDFMMEKYGLNKRTLSIRSDIPYTTIDNWYKRGYEGLKLATLRKLSDYFNTLLDFWVIEDITDPNYGKANGFQVKFEEAEHIKKYRSLDPYGKEAVDGVLDIEWRRCTQPPQETVQEPEAIYFIVPAFLSAMSAGTGQPAADDSMENYRLIREPPRGTSYIARISGNSMEPTYHDGDKLFIRACTEIESRQIGVFFMDGQQWVKELGDGKLISHNPAYPPRPMTEDVRCQGLVLGVCDKSYFQQPNRRRTVKN